MMNKKAFTLLELLMVVIIIGILATFAIPQYRIMGEKAKAAEAMNMLSALYRERQVMGQLTANLPTETINTPYWDIEIATDEYGEMGISYYNLSINATRNSGPYKWMAISVYYDRNSERAVWYGNHPGTPKEFYIPPGS